MPVPSWLSSDPVEPKLPPRTRPGWAPKPNQKVSIAKAWQVPEGAGQDTPVSDVLSPNYPGRQPVAQESAPASLDGADQPPQQPANVSPWNDVISKYAGDYANDPRFLRIAAAAARAESTDDPHAYQHGYDPNNPSTWQKFGGRGLWQFDIGPQGMGYNVPEDQLFDPDYQASQIVPQFASNYGRLQNTPGLSDEQLAAQVYGATERPAGTVGGKWQSTKAPAYENFTRAWDSLGTGQEAPQPSQDQQTADLLNRIGGWAAPTPHDPMGTTMTPPGVQAPTPPAPTPYVQPPAPQPQQPAAPPSSPTPIGPAQPLHQTEAQAGNLSLGQLQDMYGTADTSGTDTSSTDSSTDTSDLTDDVDMSASGSNLGPGPQPKAKGDWVDQARQAAIAEGIDPDVFARQIQQESGFNPSAKSPAGAIGIAQIMPDTAKSWGVDPSDPAASLKAAAKADKQYLTDYGGDYRLMLAAYNAGPAAVAKYGGVPPYQETQTYVQNIFGSGPSKTPSGRTSGGGNSVLSTAQSAVGQNTRYQFAGSGGRTMFGAQLDPTDCSGFVAWAYQRGAGIKLPAQTQAMWDSTTAIDPAQAKPGDLVMFNMDTNDPHLQHVGIYLGNGQMIHDSSLNPNGGVAVTSLWSGAQFRRVPGTTAEQLTGTPKAQDQTQADGQSSPYGQAAAQRDRIDNWTVTAHAGRQLMIAQYASGKTMTRDLGRTAKPDGTVLSSSHDVDQYRQQVTAQMQAQQAQMGTGQEMGAGDDWYSDPTINTAAADSGDGSADAGPPIVADQQDRADIAATLATPGMGHQIPTNADIVNATRKATPAAAHVTYQDLTTPPPPKPTGPGPLTAPDQGGDQFVLNQEPAPEPQPGQFDLTAPPSMQPTSDATAVRHAIRPAQTSDLLPGVPTPQATAPETRHAIQITPPAPSTEPAYADQPAGGAVQQALNTAGSKLPDWTSSPAAQLDPNSPVAQVARQGVPSATNKQGDLRELAQTAWEKASPMSGLPAQVANQASYGLAQSYLPKDTPQPVIDAVAGVLNPQNLAYGPGGVRMAISGALLGDAAKQAAANAGANAEGQQAAQLAGMLLGGMAGDAALEQAGAAAGRMINPLTGLPAKLSDATERLVTSRQPAQTDVNFALGGAPSLAARLAPRGEQALEALSGRTWLPDYAAGTPEAKVEAVMSQARDASTDGRAHVNLAALPKDVLPLDPNATESSGTGIIKQNPGGTPSTDDIDYLFDANTQKRDFYADQADGAAAIVGSNRGNVNEWFAINSIMSNRTGLTRQIQEAITVMGLVRKTAADMRAAGASASEIRQAILGHLTRPDFNLPDEYGQDPLKVKKNDPNPNYTLTSGLTRNAKQAGLRDAYTTGNSEITQMKTPTFSGNYSSAEGRMFDPGVTNDVHNWHILNVSNDWVPQFDKTGQPIIDPATGEQKVEQSHLKFAAANNVLYSAAEAVFNEMAAARGIDGYAYQSSVWSGIRDIWADEEARSLWQQGYFKEAVDVAQAKGLFDKGTTDTEAGEILNTMDKPQVQQALAQWGPWLNDPLPPELGIPGVERTFPGKKTTFKPTGEKLDIRPSTQPYRDLRAAQREAGGAQVVRGLSQDDLQKIGMDPSGDRLGWLATSHRVTEIRPGEYGIQIPVGNMDTLSYVASAIGRATGRDSMAVHLADYRLPTTGGVGFVGSAEDVQKLQAALHAEGHTAIVGGSGQSLQIPFDSPEHATAIADTIQRAGYNPADESAFRKYNGVHTTVESGSYRGRLAEGGRQYGPTTTERRDLFERVTGVREPAEADATRAGPGESAAAAAAADNTAAAGAVRAGTDRGDPGRIPVAYTARGSGDPESPRGVVALHEPTPETAARFQAAGYTPLSFEESAGAEGAANFHAAISAAKTGPFGSSVTLYPEDDYRDMRLFLSPDGKAGFALHGDDIISVFKHPESDAKNFTASAIPLAVAQGGRRLDAFDTALPSIYAKNGFRAVARLPWNDDYAPEGWNQAAYAKFNNGKPDVVFMVHDPQAVAYKPGDGARVTDYDGGIAAQQASLAEPSGPRLSWTRSPTVREALPPEIRDTPAGRAITQQVAAAADPEPILESLHAQGKLPADDAIVDQHAPPVGDARPQAARGAPPITAAEQADLLQRAGLELNDQLLIDNSKTTGKHEPLAPQQLRKAIRDAVKRQNPDLDTRAVNQQVNRLLSSSQPGVAATAYALRLAGGVVGGVAGYEYEDRNTAQDDPNRQLKLYAGAAVGAILGLGVPYLAGFVNKSVTPQALAEAQQHLAPVLNRSPQYQKLHFALDGDTRAATLAGQLFTEKLDAAFRGQLDAAEVAYWEQHQSVSPKWQGNPDAVAAFKEWQDVARTGPKIINFNKTIDFKNPANLANMYVPHVIDEDWKAAQQVMPTTDAARATGGYSGFRQNPFWQFKNSRQYNSMAEGMADGVKYTNEQATSLGAYKARVLQEKAIQDYAKGVKRLAENNTRMKVANPELWIEPASKKLVPGATHDIRSGVSLNDYLPGRLPKVRANREMGDVFETTFGKSSGVGALQKGVQKALGVGGALKHNMFGLSAFHGVNVTRQFGTSLPAMYAQYGLDGVPILEHLPGATSQAGKWARFSGEILATPARFSAEMGKSMVHTALPGAWRAFKLAEAPGMLEAARDGLTLNFNTQHSMSIKAQVGLSLFNAIGGGAAGYGLAQSQNMSPEQTLAMTAAGAIGGAALGAHLPGRNSVITAANDALFSRYIPYLKYRSYQLLKPTIGGRAAAEYANMSLGGQNLTAIARSRSLQDTARFVGLAPDFEEGVAKQWGNALFNWHGPQGTMNRMFWGSALVGSAFMLEAGNLAFGGHWSWDNDPSATLEWDMSKAYDALGWKHTDPVTGQPYRPYFDFMGPWRGQFEVLQELARASANGIMQAYNIDPPDEIKGSVTKGIPHPDPLGALGRVASARAGLLPRSFQELSSGTDYAGRSVEVAGDPAYLNTARRVVNAFQGALPTGPTQVVKGLETGQQGWGPAALSAAAGVAGFRTSRVSDSSRRLTGLDQWMKDNGVTPEIQAQLQDERVQTNQQVTDRVNALLADPNLTPEALSNQSRSSGLISQIIDTEQGRQSEYKQLLKQLGIHYGGYSPDSGAPPPPGYEEQADNLKTLFGSVVQGGTDAAADLSDRQDLDPQQLYSMAWQPSSTLGLPQQLLADMGIQAPDWLPNVGAKIDPNDQKAMAKEHAIAVQKVATDWDVDPSVMEDVVKSHLYGDGSLPQLPGMSSAALDDVASQYWALGQQPSGPDRTQAQQKVLSDAASAYGVDANNLRQRVIWRGLPMTEQPEALKTYSNATTLDTQTQVYNFANPDGTPWGTLQQEKVATQLLQAARKQGRYVGGQGGFPGTYLNASKDDVDPKLQALAEAQSRGTAAKASALQKDPNYQAYDRYYGRGKYLTNDQWSQFQAGTLPGAFNDIGTQYPNEFKHRIDLMDQWATMTPEQRADPNQKENVPLVVKDDFTGQLSRINVSMAYAHWYLTNAKSAGKLNVANLTDLDPDDTAGLPGA